MNALLRNLHPVFADALAPLLVVPQPEPERDPCESCEEQRAHYLDNRLCCKCARQARRDYEAGV